MNDIAHLLGTALSRPGGASSDFDLNPGTVLPEGRKLREVAAHIVATGDLPGPLVSSPDGG